MDRNSLKVIANEIRKDILTEIYAAQSGHPGGSLSAADLLTYLYFYEMNVSKDRRDDDDRDRFVLSKGHAAPALYAALAEKGYIPKADLVKLRRVGCYLQGHPDMKHTPGVDMSTGSLGQGISAAVGMALSGKLRKKEYRVYVLLGDGELQEGQVWEAAMFAGNRGLDNLAVVIDNNKLQIDGRIEEVNSPYPIGDKFRAFHFHVIHTDGHDFEQMERAFAEARQTKGVPSVIVADTVKGKGVSFMEGEAGWHGKAPNEAEYRKAMEELASYGEELA